jgi:RHS repeat-associated protein
MSRLTLHQYLYAGNTGTSTENPHAATSIGSLTLAYNTNGDLLTRSDNFTHTWDYNDRLMKIVMPVQQGGGFAAFVPPATTNLAYGYDPTGTRIWVKPKPTATTTYPSIYFNTDTTTSEEHIFANGMPVATVEKVGAAAPVIYWNSQDQLQSTSVVTDSSTGIKEQVEYYAFGEQKTDTGTRKEQRKFTGHEYDASDYTYAGARYLYTRGGKFISQDPVFLAIGSQRNQEDQRALEELLKNPQALNSYSYALNNPLAYVDREGKFAVPILILAVAAVSGFALQYHSDLLQNSHLKGFERYLPSSPLSSYIKSSGKAIAVAGAGLIAGPEAALGTLFITPIAADVIKTGEVTNSSVHQGVSNFSFGVVGVGVTGVGTGSYSLSARQLLLQSIETSLDLIRQAIERFLQQNQSNP